MPNIFEGHEEGFYIFFALVFLAVVAVLVIVFLVFSYLFRTFYPKPKLADDMNFNDPQAPVDEKNRT